MFYVPFANYPASAANIGISWKTKLNSVIILIQFKSCCNNFKEFVGMLLLQGSPISISMFIYRIFPFIHNLLERISAAGCLYVHSAGEVREVATGQEIIWVANKVFEWAHSLFFKNDLCVLGIAGERGGLAAYIYTAFPLYYNI